MQTGIISIFGGSELTSATRPSRGVIAIANGTDHSDRVNVLFNSLRQAGYGGPIALISDEAKCGFKSRFYKTQLDVFSPFEETLFLDTDVVALRDLATVWEFLNNGELWMALDRYSRVGNALVRAARSAHPEERHVTHAVCSENQPYFNSGVILFRKSSNTRAFFSRWHQEWKVFQTVDQLAAARACQALAVAPSILPPIYNYSLRQYRKTRSNNVVFLHCWGVPPRKHERVLRALSILPPKTGQKAGFE